MLPSSLAKFVKANPAPHYQTKAAINSLPPSRREIHVQGVELVAGELHGVHLVLVA
eukprot:UN12063